MKLHALIKRWTPLFQARALLCFVLVLGLPGCSLKQAPPDACMVAIDIGHSRTDSGAISARGRPEYEFNRDLANKLIEEMNADGLPYFIINPGGDPISLHQRVEAARAGRASFFISLHHDSVRPVHLSEWEYKGEKRVYCDLIRGYSIFVSPKNPGYEESLAVSRDLADQLISQGIFFTRHHADCLNAGCRTEIDPARGIMQFDELVVLRTNSAPALLFEAGFIIHREQELDLMNPVYQHRIASAIKTALDRHCERFLEKKQRF